MTMWRKSSRSGGGGSGGQECVELAQLTAGVGIRDSKRVRSDHLLVDVVAFGRLVERIKSGALDG